MDQGSQTLNPPRQPGGAIAYSAPFLAFVGCMAIERLLPVSPEILYPARFTLVLMTLVALSRPVIPWRPSAWAGSLILGIAVFVIWVGPDVLWPQWRSHWLFQNSLTGSAASQLPPGLKTNPVFLSIRVLGSVALVPVLEELFWRGFLWRWLVRKDFSKVPLGTYGGWAFWIVAALFASEHGPYWEVGLVAGIAYNWWLMRTRNLADCILAHAVTNGLLAMYVLLLGQWQYWL